MKCKHCQCMAPGETVKDLGYLCAFCIQMVPKRILESTVQQRNDLWKVAARIANYLRDPACIAYDA